jgi:hypothetical protein
VSSSLSLPIPCLIGFLTCSLFLFFLVCQKRNKKKNISSKVLDEVDMHNNLECKICLTTYRLFYVQGTEDLFLRCGSLAQGRQGATAQKPIKRAKFYKWLNSKGCEVPDLEIPAPKPKVAPADDSSSKGSESSIEAMEVGDVKSTPSFDSSASVSEGPKTTEFVQPLLTTPEPTPFIPPSPPTLATSSTTPTSAATSATPTPTPTTQSEPGETARNAEPQLTDEAQQTVAKE